jgi:hypothetical protein
LKEPKGLHLSILVTFFNQNISITLPKVWVSSILSRAVAIGFPTSTP